MTMMWPHAKECCSQQRHGTAESACQHLDPSHVVVILDLWSPEWCSGCRERQEVGTTGEGWWQRWRKVGVSLP